jgi:hypothetical protein
MQTKRERSPTKAKPLSLPHKGVYPLCLNRLFNPKPVVNVLGMILVRKLVGLSLMIIFGALQT